MYYYNKSSNYKTPSKNSYGYFNKFDNSDVSLNPTNEEAIAKTPLNKEYKLNLDVDYTKYLKGSNKIS